MKNIVLILFFAATAMGYAQQQLNDYKYIIIPKQFAAFKRVNQHQTSTLVKYLFTENGFNAVYEDDLPNDLKVNGCLGLRAKLVERSSMFTTKAAIRLDDCNGQDVFMTKEGRSKEKDFKDSYAEALRDAFQSFKSVNYAYQKNMENTEPITVSMKNDVKHLDKTTAKKTNAISDQKMIEQEATREQQRYIDRRPIELTPANKQTSKKPESPIKKSSMVKQVATREEQRFVDRRPVPSKSVIENQSGSSKEKTSQNTSTKISDSEALNTESAAASQKISGTLYAQKLPTGYQLVDSTPKIVITLSKTSMPDYYIAQSAAATGVVFKKNNTWVFEHYTSGQFMTQDLDIKF